MGKINRNQKKKKHERLSVEELIADKPWAYIVTAMPASVQRNTITALEAYDKENPRRMEQAVSMIKEGDTRLLKLMLAIVYYIKRNHEKTISIVEKLIEEEAAYKGIGEKNEPSQSTGGAEGGGTVAEKSIPELNLKNIMEVSSALRAEVYNSILLNAYDAMGDSQKAVEIGDSFFPPIRKAHDVYEPYLVNLLLTGRYEDGKREARDFIDCITKGEFGTDYFTQFFSAGFDFSEVYNDVSLKEIREQIESGRNPKISTDCVTFYQGLLECDVNTGSGIDDDFKEMTEYIQSLDADVKYHPVFMQLICSMIIETSRAVYEDDKWSRPFKTVLDFVDASGYFCKEHDPNGIYDDLIPSGYRVLEDVEYHKDEEMDRFIGGMIDDALAMLNSYGDPHTDERTQYMLWARGEGALWNIARHCLEGEEQRETVRKSFDRLKELYPYKWKFLEPEIRGLMEEPKKYMDEIRDAVMKSSRRKGLTEQGMQDALEEAYHKTLGD